jgi:tetratricopeptide (TPR) repeat protein
MKFARLSALCVASVSCLIVLSSCSGPKSGNAGESDASTQSAKNTESEETLLKNLFDQQAALPKNSPKLKAPLEKLASYYELQNRYDLAEKYLQPMILCHETNWNWERYSTALAEQKKFDEAIDAMKHSVEIVSRKKKADDTAAVYIRYAKLLEKAGRQTEAAPYRKKAHELAPKVKNSTVRWH